MEIKSCCGFDLRTGVLIIASLEIFVGTLLIFGCAYDLMNNYHEHYRIGLANIIFLTGILVVIDVLWIYVIRKNQRQRMKYLAAASALWNFSALAFTVTSGFFVLSDHRPGSNRDEKLFCVCVAMFVMVLEYFFLKVKSSLCEEKETTSNCYVAPMLEVQTT